MAKTKQTARKSSGGRAPRRQLAVRSAQAFRSYMTSQQSVGNAYWGGSDNEKKKTSFLNFENTFGQFTFTVPVETNKSFVPTLYMGPSNMLGLSFASKFNGKNVVFSVIF